MLKGIEFGECSVWYISVIKDTVPVEQIIKTIFFGSNWSQPFTISGELLTLYKDNSSQATVFIKQ